jgi:hypothetical protein
MECVRRISLSYEVKFLQILGERLFYSSGTHQIKVLSLADLSTVRDYSLRYSLDERAVLHVLSNGLFVRSFAAGNITEITKLSDEEDKGLLVAEPTVGVEAVTDLFLILATPRFVGVWNTDSRTCLYQYNYQYKTARSMSTLQSGLLAIGHRSNSVSVLAIPLISLG